MAESVTISKMRAIILAGGLGTRMQELTRLVPKPMVEIGGFPMLWHIMKIYHHFGVNDFSVALGYRSEVIKEFFANYRMRIHSVHVDIGHGETRILDDVAEKWSLDLIETGLHTQTGGRLSRMRDAIGDDTFFLTYGDGVADIDIEKLVAFHRSHGKIATVTAVRPPSKFGALDIGEDGLVREFSEKPISGETWISGGFFVLNREVFKYVSDDVNCIFEREPLEAIAADGQLAAFKHNGFWQCIDMAKDVEHVNELWESGNAPWKVWS